MNYASSFTIKALLPFFLLYFYIKKKKMFFLLLFLIGSFYAFSLMQKSHIIAIIIPLLVYLLLERKWLLVIANMAYIVLVVGIMVYITNPDLAEKPIPLEDNTELSDALEEEVKRRDPESPILRIAYGLYERTMLVPGEIVSKWFRVIPEKRPFLNGNGYRIVAKLKGEAFVNYTADLYPLVRPSFAKRGLKGNVNVASFMYEYSNFGAIGLVLSGILLAFVFFVIEKIFAARSKLNMSINAFPVLILSSGALNTLLFSGGWGLSILLFLLFLGHKKPKHEDD
jgi:hypothetical protein